MSRFIRVFPLLAFLTVHSLLFGQGKSMKSANDTISVGVTKTLPGNVALTGNEGCVSKCDSLMANVTKCKMAQGFATNASLKKWEYWTFITDQQDFGWETLSQKGSEGWELVSVTTLNTSGKLLWSFKRVVQ